LTLASVQELANTTNMVRDAKSFSLEEIEKLLAIVSLAT